jgi:CDP-glucose 4,6-dehydratase
VRQVVELARTEYGSGAVHYGDVTEGPHESRWLALEIAKASVVLGVQPKWSLAESVTRTMTWYQAQHAGIDARALCLADIADHEMANGEAFL